jgi:hypothetical protein
LELINLDLADLPKSVLPGRIHNSSDFFAFKTIVEAMIKVGSASARNVLLCLHSAWSGDVASLYPHYVWLLSVFNFDECIRGVWLGTHAGERNIFIKAVVRSKFPVLFHSYIIEDRSLLKWMMMSSLLTIDDLKDLHQNYPDSDFNYVPSMEESKYVSSPKHDVDVFSAFHVAAMYQKLDIVQFIVYSFNGNAKQTIGLRKDRLIWMLTNKNQNPKGSDPKVLDYIGTLTYATKSRPRGSTVMV